MEVDARGIPTHACPMCGGTEFIVHAGFDDNDIAWWGLDAECLCGAMVTVPCPADSTKEAD